MPYILVPEAGKSLEESYSGEAYISPSTGNTECVAFLQAKIPGMPVTSAWKPGKAITQTETSIAAGTAIATFVDGVYPGPGRSKHAAIYLSQNSSGIQVLDQWAKQKKVLKRTIRWVVDANTSIQNEATRYSVIE